MIWLFFVFFFLTFYSCDGNTVAVTLDANNTFYTFYSPGYPGQYPRSADDTWTITSPEGTNVVIYCPRLKIEPSRCRQAYVTFNSGQKICSGPITTSSDTNTMTVNFVSRKRSGTGFICTAFYTPSDTVNDAPQCTLTTSSGDRIVGGTATPITDIPFQVMLLTSYSLFQFCGGSLISDRYVITAAHCVDGSSEQSLLVALGVDEKSYFSNNLIAVEDITVHQSFSGSTLSNDVALIKLVSTIRFSSTMQPVCLADVSVMEQLAMAGDKAIVSGFGTLSSQGQASYNLQSVEVPIVSNSTCGQAYGSELFTDTMVCAGETGKDSCQGDSGGPMFVSDTLGTYLIGLVSWGYGCAEEGFPGVYTRVSTYKTWVEDII